ncbi:MAG: hypothetical protein QM778_26660 [Myxococcales bacterium]
MRLNKVLSLSLMTIAGMLATACGGDDPESAPSEGQIAEILGVGQLGSCSISSCHGTDTASAGLDFMNATSLHDLLVDKPSCEAPKFKLVDPGSPETSWLYLKLTAPADAKRKLEENPDWGEPGTGCEEASGFGKRMPETGQELSEDKKEQIRKWIAAGAP